MEYKDRKFGVTMDFIIKFPIYLFKGIYFIFAFPFLKSKKDAPVGEKKSFIQNIKDNFAAASLKKRIEKGNTNEQEMKMDFEAADATKSSKKIMWEYIAKTSDGRAVKGHFEAYSKVEVHSFLLSEGMTVYSIRTSPWIRLLHSNLSGKNGAKMKNKDLIFFLTQLSTYIKAGIPLAESLNILTKQFKKKSYKRMFRSMMYDLTMGDNFSTVMEKQGDAFPSILINMVKASELTGELPEALDDMADYFTDLENTRKEMVSALTYPVIVFIFAIAVITFIMLYVVPRFVDIYATMENSEIPKFTLFVISVSNFMQKWALLIFAIIIIILIILKYLYDYVLPVRRFLQWTLMHIPVLGDIMIYREVTTFTKTFASLLSHNVFITDSMNVLNRITKNEIYRSMIVETIDNLAHGEKISTAFKDHWAFPLPAYEMIVTGEKTGQLAEMMKKVSAYYQQLHRSAVSRVKSLLEPILIIFLTVCVGAIVLAVVVPMFNMYSSVQNYY